MPLGSNKDNMEVINQTFYVKVRISEERISTPNTILALIGVWCYFGQKMHTAS